MQQALPARPDLEHYRKEAKAFVRAFREGDPRAIRRAEAVLGTRARDRFALSDAQYVIAVEHGYTSWAEFKQACEATGLEALKGLERGEVVLGYDLRYTEGHPVEVLVRKRLHRYDIGDEGSAVSAGREAARLARRGREGGRRVLTEPERPRRRVRRHGLSAPARVALRADGRGFARRVRGGAGAGRRLLSCLATRPQGLTFSACARGLFLQCLFLRLVRDRYAGSISRLRIHACLPTCRPLVNPYCSNSSAVALNRNRP